MADRWTQQVFDSEMKIFFAEQGLTRVCGEAYCCTPQPETRGRRRSAENRPFLDGH